MKKLPKFLFITAMFCGSLFADSYSLSRPIFKGLDVSGQYPINPNTGLIVQGSIQDLTNQVVNNLEQVLQQQGFALKDVVSLTIYLTDMRDYAAVDQVLGQRFPKPYPTREVAAVAGLLYDSRIEISCQASK